MKQMNPLEILLVEDDPADVELTLRALKKRNLTNKVKVANDGAQSRFPGPETAQSGRA